MRVVLASPARQHSAGQIGVPDRTHPRVVLQQAAELRHGVPAVASMPGICNLLQQALHLGILLLLLCPDVPSTCRPSSSSSGRSSDRGGVSYSSRQSTILCLSARTSGLSKHLSKQRHGGGKGPVAASLRFWPFRSSFGSASRVVELTAARINVLVCFVLLLLLLLFVVSRFPFCLLSLAHDIVT